MISQIKQYEENSFASTLTQSDDTFFTDEMLECYDDVLEVDHLTEIRSGTAMLAEVHGEYQVVIFE